MKTYRERVEALLREAAVAGDELTVALCRQVLVGPWGPATGSMEARDKVDAMLREAAWRGADTKPVPYACCPAATPRYCVCEAAFDCPEHGDTHVGSHE